MAALLRPLLKGDGQKNRGFVFKVYNENAGGNRHPIRGLETPDYLYLFNPWSDGENQFRTATQGTVTYRKMKELAATDENIAARLELFDHRVVEEFYDMRNDPDCLHNLVDAKEHQKALTRHRQLLEREMKTSNDHALAVFQNREDPAARKAYMEKANEEAAERRASNRKKKKKANPKEKTAKGKCKSKRNEKTKKE